MIGPSENPGISEIESRFVVPTGLSFQLVVVASSRHPPERRA